jgi:hypothetical protein
MPQNDIASQEESELIPENLKKFLIKHHSTPDGGSVTYQDIAQIKELLELQNAFNNPKKPYSINPFQKI